MYQKRVSLFNKIYMKAPAPLIIAGIEILEKIGYIIPQYC